MSDQQKQTVVETSFPSFGVDWWTMLSDPQFLTDPYPELNRIREMAPIHYDPASGIYFVLGHREFNAMAKTPQMGRDTRFWARGWSSPENRQREPETYEPLIFTGQP